MTIFFVLFFNWFKTSTSDLFLITKEKSKKELGKPKIVCSICYPFSIIFLSFRIYDTQWTLSHRTSTVSILYKNISMIVKSRRSNEFWNLSLSFSSFLLFVKSEFANHLDLPKNNSTQAAIKTKELKLRFDMKLLWENSRLISSAFGWWSWSQNIILICVMKKATRTVIVKWVYFPSKTRRFFLCIRQ